MIAEECILTAEPPTCVAPFRNLSDMLDANHGQGKVGDGSGPAPVASAPPPPEYLISYAEEDGCGSAGYAQPCAPPPLDGMPLSGQHVFVPLLGKVDAPPSRCGR